MDGIADWNILYAYWLRCDTINWRYSLKKNIHQNFYSNARKKTRQVNEKPPISILSKLLEQALVNTVFIVEVCGIHCVLLVCRKSIRDTEKQKKIKYLPRVLKSKKRPSPWGCVQCNRNKIIHFDGVGEFLVCIHTFILHNSNSIHACPCVYVYLVNLIILLSFIFHHSFFWPL